MATPLLPSNLLYLWSLSSHDDLENLSHSLCLLSTRITGCATISVELGWNPGLPEAGANTVPAELQFQPSIRLH